MAIRNKNLDPHSWPRKGLQPWRFRIPTNDQDYYVSVADPSTNLTANTPISLTRTWCPQPCQMTLVLTDNVGTDLAVTLTVVYRDVRGDLHTESIALDNSTSSATTAYPVKELVAVTPTSVAGTADASDLLELGFVAVSSGNTIEFALPVPVKVDSAATYGGVRDTVKAVMLADALPTGTVTINADRQSIKFTGGASTGKDVIVLLDDPFGE